MLPKCHGAQWKYFAVNFTLGYSRGVRVVVGGAGEKACKIWHTGITDCHYIYSPTIHVQRYRAMLHTTAVRVQSLQIGVCNEIVCSAQSAKLGAKKSCHC